ncbi:MAG: minor capsid protein [Lactobacillus sp.]|nr:minor capsid protein [Lactobacillus sp.]MDN6663145.1 minor capsid protein [Tetragenococcus koreensis]
MDLYERLYDAIVDAELPFKTMLGFLPEQKDIVCLYPLPGSQTVEQYFDGTKEREMLYEIGFRTNDQQKANEVLWKITEYLDTFAKIESENDSFSFNSLEVSEMPFISEMDIDGLNTFLLDLKVNIDQF